MLCWCGTVILHAQACAHAQVLGHELQEHRRWLPLQFRHSAFEVQMLTAKTCGTLLLMCTVGADAQERLFRSAGTSTCLPV
ncbi:hypothetical protein JKP88DRAFT_226174 [Tribonema minus]|uniref:Secreted protein n=1 Tax=Tribonema minus TaxID=303371 RepID=A0A836CAZ9_9STRA|nr:hypothetical protein JKP88DRAFT_226174 [Tribonema minus]